MSMVHDLCFYDTYYWPLSVTAEMIEKEACTNVSEMLHLGGPQGCPKNHRTKAIRVTWKEFKSDPNKRRGAEQSYAKVP